MLTVICNKNIDGTDWKGELFKKKKEKYKCWLHAQFFYFNEMCEVQYLFLKTEIKLSIYSFF